MKRIIGLLIFASLAGLALWPSIPSGHAGSSSDVAKTAKTSLPQRSIVTRPVKDDSVKPATVGLPNILNEKAPMSAAVATFVGGRNATFNHVTIAADFSGRENYVADRAGTFDDFTLLFPDPDDTITKVAFSEHTFANGFNENVVYYGDAAGNFFVGTDANPGVNVGPSIDFVRQINIPSLVASGASGGVTLVNPQAGDCTDDEPVVTGIAVNPVADLGDFGVACGTIGEVVYVSTLDTGACSAGANGQPFRTRIFAFGFTDGAGPGAATPVGALEIVRNPNSNAGIAVDDDGSLYFHLADNLSRTNAAIFKVTELSRTVAGCAVNPRVQRVIASVPSGLSGGINPNSAQGTGASPIIVSAGQRLTNYSGPSPTWGNIFAITAGPGNVIYAAMAQSFVDGNPATGGFVNSPALGATPSMIVSLVDQSGAFDACTGLVTAAGIAQNVGGQIPVGDGFADRPAIAAATLFGVNNFRVFVLGNGPDIRPVAPATSPIVTASTLKLDMQIDPSNYSGIAVNEEGTVYVISGGGPNLLGGNPSPTRGEILAFQDSCPADRRADYIDFRGDAFPGTNVGDGDSDRFDHIFFQAPNDASGNPSALSGLARGFLRYTNRLAPNAISPGVALGQSGGPNKSVQGDDDTDGPIFFEGLDPSHQVAGGDDQNPPFRGDDTNGLSSPLSVNNPVLANPLEGGFEFLFGVPGPNGNVWNAFFLNSNGSVSFNGGDTDNTPSNPEWYSGLPKIAPAWTDLNPSSRAATPTNFPVQAMGFAGVNAFKVRNINVPQFGNEGCVGDTFAGGRTNTFAVTLYDDGTGIDENSNKALDPADPTGDNVDPAYDLQEGPTDLRFTRETTTNTLIGAPPRASGSGNFAFDYARMDLLGAGSPTGPTGNDVIAGYTIGNGTNTNPPGLCEINLGEAARQADQNAFGVLQGQTASIGACLIGEGTEPAIFERFNEGVVASVGSQGEIFLSTPDFDLRNESNDPQLTTPTRERDLTRGRVAFVGVARPPGPTVTSVTGGNFVVAPNQPNKLINALGSVDIFVAGTGFVPNEVTTVCLGAPEQRPGKTVSNAMELRIDNDNNGIADVIIPLTNVTPVSPNLLRGTLPSLAPLFAGTAFPINPTTAIGPNSVVRVTTTFTAGDNNAFGAISNLTNADTTSLLGTRAPVVLTAVPTSGDCGVVQNVAITGAAFRQGDGVTANVTSVTAVDGGTLVTATAFNIVNSQNINATFTFPPGSGGRLFYIFANGPNGSSRNLVTLPAGTPAGVPLGNEAGNAVTFNCLNAFQFSAASYNVTEDCVTVPVTITRGIAGAAPSSVDVSTSDGTALQKSDYTATFRTITFAAGETSKTVDLPITEDSFNEADETFTVTLSNPTGGAGLGSQSTATVTILNDDNPPPAANAIDDATTFVGQHYHDFLNRQADPAGQAFWVSQITACGANVACIEQARITVSGSFFQSIEFQETGFFVLKSQRAAFGKRSQDPATRYPYLPFLKDTQQVSQGVIFGQPGANALLEANKQAYATQVVTSAPFITAYPLAQTASQFVDALFATAMVVPTAAERTAAITAFGGGGTAGRVTAFRSVVDANSMRTAELNPAFVLLEYYGYLRRNPTDPPDNNDVGYQFWLTKLNAFGGNFINAEMVKAFLSSIEYRQRFGNP